MSGAVSPRSPTWGGPSHRRAGRLIARLSEVNEGPGIRLIMAGTQSCPLLRDIAMIDGDRTLSAPSTRFPVEPRPYRCLARALGLSEHGLLSLLARDVGSGRISHIGARFAPKHHQRHHARGAVRAAGAAGERGAAPQCRPGHRLSVTAGPAHRYNLWFVAGARDAASFAAVLDDARGRTSAETPLALPLE